MPGSLAVVIVDVVSVVVVAQFHNHLLCAALPQPKISNSNISRSSNRGTH
jgi:hypothetical protein